MAKRVTEIQPKRIRSLKQAKRLLADYIYYFQKKETSENELKTIVYALIKYAELCKIEDAIKNPEAKALPPIEINVRNN